VKQEGQTAAREKDLRRAIQNLKKKKTARKKLRTVEKSNQKAPKGNATQKGLEEAITQSKGKKRVRKRTLTYEKSTCDWHKRQSQSVPKKSFKKRK
jgi:hypothetical protein